MSNPLKVLSRLFKKNPDNNVVAELYSRVSQPLFVHPQLGEMVIRSYLDVLAMPPKSENAEQSFTSRINNIAVIDVSGALVSRNMNVPCGVAPVSYEGIKQEFQTLMEDDSIKTIIGRFDTPGGMASQNMDLSDFIYASRGQGKKLVAMVDDMAYSAGYGIASAFEEIWVTRTSGVGSVGVVSYHEDRSEANSKAGVKVEYIYAGEKKVLGNPNQELSDEGRAQYQQEVTRLYNIFTATVARNLGTSVEAIKSTEAGVFHGEEALAAGFAHKMGTFDELLASLFEKEAQQLVTEEKPSQLVDDSAVEAVESPQVTDLEVSEEVSATLITEQDDAPKVEVAVADESEDDDEEDESEDKKAKAVDLAVEEDDDEEEEDEASSKAPFDDDSDEEEDEDEESKAKASQEVQEAEDKELPNQYTVKALCAAAGCPEAANDFILAEMSVDDVRKSLIDFTSTPETSIVNAAPFGLKRDRASVKEGWKAAFKEAAKGFN